MIVLDFFVDLFHSLALVLFHSLESLVLLFVPTTFRKQAIEGELVLITGAGSGIGRLQAVKFAAAGCNLVLWDINGKGIEETARMVRETGQKAWPYVCDVSRREAVYEKAKKVQKEAGEVTVLVNNAGIIIGRRFLDLDDSEIQKTMDVNAMAHAWTMKAFLPSMVENNHGHVVTIASIMGEVAAVGMADYCMSKYAAVGLHQSVMREVRAGGKDGVNFTLINPYMIDTGMFQGAQIRYDVLIPTLQPDYVAERVLEAVQTKTELIRTPYLLHLMVLLKDLLPMKAVLALEDFFQTDKAMNNFVGRRRQKEG